LPATSAETFEDLAGTGRRHPALGLAMAVCCFSLIGLPLTVGFFGKLFLIKPALDLGTTLDSTWMIWLVVITMINAAISAAYYLRIVATMFLRPEPADASAADEDEDAATGAEAQPAAATPALAAPMPIVIAIGLSVAGTLLFGTLPPATQLLESSANTATNIESGGITSFTSSAPGVEPTEPPAATQPVTAASLGR
jgi:NADH:ubiquinone oxidoreductase subunit 2 (subunit N)